MSRRALAVLASCGPRARCLQSVHALDQEPDAKAQAKDNLALWGTVGLGWPDFDTDDQPFSIFFGLTYSPRRFWDVGARIGFYELDEMAASFSLGVFTALRI